MRRRDFIAALGGAVIWPLYARAQHSEKIHRVGYVGSDAASQAHLVTAFEQGLRDLGRIPGQNVLIEYRWTGGDVERIPRAVAELIALPVDVILAATSAFAEAARLATSTLPIVFVSHGDPVGAGHAISLARPGKNLTGLSTMTPEVNAKGLELLKEAVPSASRIAALWEPRIPSNPSALHAVEETALRLGVRIQPVALHDRSDVDGAVETAAQSGDVALLVISGSIAFAERDRLAELALKHRLPTLFTQREQAEAGGLLCYGAHLPDLFRRAASYVDRILRGANPGDLPIEQPTKFELVVNVKTAKALGLTIPPSLLARADEVIE